MGSNHAKVILYPVEKNYGDSVYIGYLLLSGHESTQSDLSICLFMQAAICLLVYIYKRIALWINIRDLKRERRNIVAYLKYENDFFWINIKCF